MLERNSNNLFLSNMVDEAPRRILLESSTLYVSTHMPAHIYIHTHIHACVLRVHTILVSVQSLEQGAGQEIYVLCRPDMVLQARSPLIRAPTRSYVLL